MDTSWLVNFQRVRNITHVTEVWLTFVLADLTSANFLWVRPTPNNLHAIANSYVGTVDWLVAPPSITRPLWPWPYSRRVAQRARCRL